MQKLKPAQHLRIGYSIIWRILTIGIIALLITLTVNVAFAQQSKSGLVNSNKFSARILVRSAQRVEVGTELYAPILDLPFSEGKLFNKDDILIRFDCSRYNAEQRAASANAKATKIEHRTKAKLYKYQAVGKDELELAAAQKAKANAELKVHQVRSDQCEFQAPFAGRIVTRHVRKHEFPISGKPVITIINDRQLELELVAPSLWLRWMKIGQEYKFEIDETGKVYNGSVTQIGAEVDPVSQTIKIIGKFNTAPESVLAGMSGTAHFSGGS